MGLIAQSMGLRGRVSEHYRPANEPPVWMTGGIESSAGITVDEPAAIKCNTVSAIVRGISQDLGSLPRNCYEEMLPRGKRKATEHRTHRLVHSQPNPRMTATVFFETQVSHMLFCGNAYAWIEYDGGSGVKAIWPLRPDLTEPKLEKDGKTLYYKSRLQDGSAEERFEPWEILHVPGFGYDGLRGYSPIALQREAIGLAIGAERLGGKLFSGGLHLGVVYEHPKELTEVAYARLQKSIEEDSGLRRAHRAKILEEGMKASKIGIPPNDAQFLETRKHQKAEIAGWYRYPLWMLQEWEHQSVWGPGLEQSSIGYVIYTLRPIAVRFEQEYDRKLFSKDQTGRFFIKHVFDGLMRGDFKTRNEGYAVGRQWGWFSANDVLELDDRNPIGEQGDQYLVPLNMIPADMVREVLGADAKDEEGKSGKGGDGSSDKKGDRSTEVLRGRLARAHAHLFRDVGARIVRRETKAIRKAARKMSLGAKVFQSWAEDWYRGHEQSARRALQPVVLTLVQTILDAVDMVPDERAVREQIDSLVRNHVEASRSDLAAACAAPDPEEQLLELMDSWEEERAERFASESCPAIVASLMDRRNLRQA